jgi:MFS family permease
MNLDRPEQEPTPEVGAMASRHPMLAVLRIRNFRMLWIGQGISVLGIQFYMVALPWLVLMLTGDPFKVGAVLAMAGIPRALFMLVGGALTDRFSPRDLMISSNAARVFMLGSLTFLVLTGIVDMWMLYLLALTTGLAEAFFFPAQSSIMPQIVEPKHLLSGNSIVHGTVQLSIALGPALAGLLIAGFFGTPQPHGVSTEVDRAAADLSAIGLAFGINTVTLIISVMAFWLINVHELRKPVEEEAGAASLLSSIREGLGYVLRDRTLRLLFLVTATGHFCIEGPLLVGVPVLANTRFPEGAAAFGIIMSALGAGMMIGIILAGTLPRLPSRHMGMIWLIIISLTGFGLMLLGFASTMVLAAVDSLIMGMALGFVIIQFTSWIQIYAPKALLGRVMSLMIFSSVGLIPISQALSGALIKISIPGLFLGAGIIMTVVVGWAAVQPGIRNMNQRAD